MEIPITPLKRCYNAFASLVTYPPVQLTEQRGIRLEPTPFANGEPTTPHFDLKVMPPCARDMRL